MNTVFSSNMKKFRQQKNYTQEQVAEILGVSVHSVSRWERGTTQPDITMLPELARLYCVTADDFFKETSDAYGNYAQRLASVFEATHNPEDFIRADIEFKKLLRDGRMTSFDMWSYGITHQFMMNYCIDNAFYWFDKALQKGKDEDEFAYHKAKIHRMKLCSQLGKDDENIANQLEAIQKKPEDASEWCLLLTAFIFAGHYEEAYKYYLKAAELFYDNWELYIHGGDICAKLKLYEEAFACWDKAETLGTNFLDGKYSKASCLECLGEYEKAYKIWQEIADTLKKKGYDIEAREPESKANECFERFTEG